ncbi:MAG TPA: hypothetical protein VFM82_04245 [Flavobacteriaceae bacterium]|nr:hypothetical protein [Flavobacteriaceae bacterium]
MKAKEYFYQHNFLNEILTSPAYSECNKKELNSFWNKIYCFLLKKYYRAKATGIDYANKIAYIQFDHEPYLEDDRLHSAHSRIVELHYPDLKTLLLPFLRKKNGLRDFC